METRQTIQHLIPTALVAASALKPVEIQLAWYVEDFKVVAVQNTTVLLPGEWLSVAAVDQLCSTPGWTVKMADNDLMAALLGLGTGAVGTALKI